MLIEDDPDDGFFYRTVLEQAFPHTALLVIDNSVEALPTIERMLPRPSLILLDWHLPPEGGSPVLAQLQGLADYAKLRVVIVSAQVSPVLLEQARHAQVYAVVEKPATLAGLQAMIEQLLVSQSEEVAQRPSAA